MKNATDLGEFGYGLLGQNCVDLLKGALTAAGINVSLAELIPEDSPVRAYAELVDAMVEIGTYAILDTVGEILATLGMVGNDIANAFDIAFTDFAAGDFAGGVAALWNGFTDTVDDIWDGLLDIFGFSDPEDFSFYYTDDDWNDDIWSDFDDYYWNYDVSDEFSDEEWWSYDEEWAEWEEWINCEYGYLDPVVLDLDGDGLTFKSALNSTAFARESSEGELLQLGWVGPNDGILAIDNNGNGLVDDLTEVNFFRSVGGARNDLQALAAFDSNSDGVLDASDAGFGSFLVWRDLNGDGVCDVGEAVGLTEAGIKAISLGYTSDVYEAEGNIVSAVGTFELLCGETRELANVDLAVAGAVDTIVRLDSTEGLSVVVDEALVGTGAGRVAVIGRSGSDQIETTLTADCIIAGADGDDRLVGGQGDDILIGGAGADTFVIFAAGGSDVIRDFSADEGDRISLTTFSDLSFEELLAASAEADGSVVINLSEECQVTIAGVSVADLEADWFLIAA